MNMTPTPTTCSRCEVVKKPRKCYLNLLKSQGLPYVCSACRESAPPPVIYAGKLGVVEVA